MSITISSTTLANPTKDQMYETTANSVSFSCSASTPEATSTDTKKVSYSSLSYAWTFSDGGSASGSSGKHTFTGLSKGAEVTLKASVKVTCTKTVSTRHLIEDGHYEDVKDAEGNVIGQKWVDTSYWSNWSSTTSNLSATSSASQKANTHPGTCSAFESIAAGQIIEIALTPAKVRTWCTHCGKWLSWKYQVDKYSDANDCKVSSKDWVTASWYNSCVTAAEASDVCSTVKGGPKGTIITASLFTDLDSAISRRV